ncbi:MAG: hypothetical protein ABR507_04185 [Actinomycetota bacterium]|nr:hypothetical protein [Actinomycetota bacterium]
MVGNVTITTSGSDPKASIDSGVRGGDLVLTLVDQNKNHPEGIPVQIRGPINKTLLSNKDGLVELHGPSGSYGFQVMAGCSDNVIVSFGQSGKSYVVDGRTGTGMLGVSWHRRIGPGDSTFASEVPHWLVGDIVDVSWDVIDRCTSSKSPSVSVDHYAYLPSSNVEVIGVPTMSVDDNAQAHLKVRCKTAGPMNLYVYDRTNPGDKTDLVTSMLFDSANKNETRGECRNPGPTP